MADCGICLEPLKKPTSIPCGKDEPHRSKCIDSDTRIGHIHCEKCLRSHILSGEDAFTSTCPTCRQTFYTGLLDVIAVNPWLTVCSYSGLGGRARKVPRIYPAFDPQSVYRHSFDFSTDKGNQFTQRPGQNSLSRSKRLR